VAFAIICSGGDAPGMNPAIKKFVDLCHKNGVEAYLIYDGLEGMIDGKVKKASYEDVSGIIHLGGTIIRSSRSKRFFEYSYRKQAYDNLQKYNIQALIVLGGDGSFRAFDRFSAEFPINFVGIPSTIDNDIYGSEYCLGVDTALNDIRDALDKIRDTAASFSRAFVVEVMGRECGYLAIASAITSGAEICVIPEKDLNRADVEEKLQKEMINGRRYILAIVAEGTKQTQEIKEWIASTFNIDTKVTILGHIQRGGNPTVYDRMMAFDFTVLAFDYLLKHNNSNKVAVYKNGKFGFLEIDEVVNNHYHLPSRLLESVNYLD